MNSPKPGDLLSSTSGSKPDLRSFFLIGRGSNVLTDSRGSRLRALPEEGCSEGRLAQLAGCALHHALVEVGGAVATTHGFPSVGAGRGAEALTRLTTSTKLALDVFAQV